MNLTNYQMNIKQHYCEVDQDQAYEARELLVRAGEPICEDNYAFDVFEGAEYNKLVFSETGDNDNGDWYVGSYVTEDLTQLTYPQFKEMLKNKIDIMSLGVPKELLHQK